VNKWGAAEWSAAATVAAAAVYVILGFLAYAQLRQNRSLRELESRPYVILDFEERRALIYLVIRNIGKTPAKNVVIRFDQPLKTAGQLRHRDPNQYKIFNSPIPMLAPERAIRIPFGIGHEILGDETIPHSYTVSIRYTNLKANVKYNDPDYVIDLEHLRESALGPKGFSDLVEELASIRRQISGWGGSGADILVHTRDHDSHLRRQNEWLASETTDGDSDGS
jgi:hypothetical protein